MRYCVFLLVGAAAAFVLALPAAADEFQACMNAPAGTHIAPCTLAIESGKYSGKALAALYDTRGLEYWNNGNADGAIADYTEAMRIDPADNDYLFRGIAWAKKGNFDLAISDYNQAISFDPKNPDIYYERGLAWDYKGDLDRAIADYDQVIRLAPKHSSAYYRRALDWRAKGDSDRAIGNFTEAIKYAPNDSDAYANRGFVWTDKGDFDRAIADYNEAIRLNPNNAFRFLLRGFAFKAKGDLSRAIADYTEAIRIDPNNFQAYKLRGQANYFSNALPKALADLNQATELNPTYAYSALWLDIVVKRSNLPSRLSEATAHIDMTKWPAPVIRLYLGQLTADAVVAAVDDPNVSIRTSRLCEAHFYSGELTLLRGSKQEAARLFRLAVAECPKSFTESDNAKIELKALGEI